MFQCKVLIPEFFPINRLPPGPISRREVPALTHEILDDPVKLCALVVKGLAGAAVT